MLPMDTLFILYYLFTGQFGMLLFTFFIYAIVFAGILIVKGNKINYGGE